MRLEPSGRTTACDRSLLAAVASTDRRSGCQLSSTSAMSAASGGSAVRACSQTNCSVVSMCAGSHSTTSPAADSREREILPKQRDADAGHDQRADDELVVGLEHGCRRQSARSEKMRRQRVVRADRRRHDPRQPRDRRVVGVLDPIAPRRRRRHAVDERSQRHRGDARVAERAVIEGSRPARRPGPWRRPRRTPRGGARSPAADGARGPRPAPRRGGGCPDRPAFPR